MVRPALRAIGLIARYRGMPLTDTATQIELAELRAEVARLRAAVTATAMGAALSAAAPEARNETPTDGASAPTQLSRRGLLLRGGAVAAGAMMAAVASSAPAAFAATPAPLNAAGAVLLGETDEQTLLSVTHPTGAPFKLIAFGAGPQADASYDHVALMGWNPHGVGGVVGQVGEPSLFMGFEDGWLDSGSQGSEWYIAYNSPDLASVSLFRPFYTRVTCNSNADHAATSFIDIGTDGTGSFSVTKGDFGPVLLAVTPTMVEVAAPYLVLGHATPKIVFDNAFGGVGWMLTAPNTDQLVFVDKDGRNHVVLTSGSTADLSLTHVQSRVQIDSSLEVNSGRAAAVTIVDGTFSASGSDLNQALYLNAKGVGGIGINARPGSGTGGVTIYDGATVPVARHIFGGSGFAQHINTFDANPVLTVDGSADQTAELARFRRAGNLKSAILSNGAYLSDDASAGLYLKDDGLPAHYWRLSVSNAGVLQTTDAGTTRPT